MPGPALVIVTAVAACAIVAPAGAQPARRRAAPPPVHALTGVVEDVYTKQPFANRTVTLQSFWEDCKFDERAVQTDDAGRFTFEAVPGCRWASARMNLYAKACDRCLRTEMKTVKGTKVEPRFTQTDLGTMFVADDDWLARHLGVACTGNGALPDTSMLAIPLPTLRWRPQPPNWQGAWRSSYSEHGTWMTGKLLPWPAVLCLVDEPKEIGQYVTKGAAASGPPVKGYALTTQVRLIRRSDQQVFTTTLTADPPKQTTAFTINGHWGDTDPAVLAWLKEIAAANPAGATPP